MKSGSADAGGAKIVGWEHAWIRHYYFLCVFFLLLFFSLLSEGEQLEFRLSFHLNAEWKLSNLFGYHIQKFILTRALDSISQQKRTRSRLRTECEPTWRSSVTSLCAACARSKGRSRVISARLAYFLPNFQKVCRIMSWTDF